MSIMHTLSYSTREFISSRSEQVAYRYSGLLIALCITALTIDASNKKTSFSFVSAFSVAPLIVLPKTTTAPTRMPIPIAQKPTEEKKFNPLDLLPSDIWPIIDAYSGHTTLHANARSFVASHHDKTRSIICSLAWNPKENSFASGDDQGTVCIWDAKTHTKKYTFEHNSNTVYSIDYSPDAEYLVSAAGESIGLWNCNNTELLPTTINNGRCRRAVFDRDGSRIALCGNKKLSIWDIHHQRAINNFLGDHTYKAFAGFGEGNDMCWLHHNPALLCAVNQLGRGHAYLVDIRESGKVGKVLASSFTFFSTSQITCSLDDNHVMWVNNNKVALYDIKADKSLPSIITHPDWRKLIVSLHLSNDDQKILLPTHDSLHTLEHDSLHMFETKNGKNLESRDLFSGQSGFTPEVLCASWSPDERHIIAGDASGYIHHLQQPSYLRSLST
jgi:hypothetical protein